MKALKTHLAVALVALSGASLASGAHANPYADYMVAQLLPGWAQSDGEHVAGLEMTLAHGWKTYWRSPGSAGIPPRFDWSGSTNMKSVQIIWPRPMIFDFEGMRSIGYKDHVVLPLKVIPKDPSRPVHLQGRIDVGICSDVCVPLEVNVDADLPAEGGHRTPRIAAALANRPYSPREAKLTDVTCEVEPGASKWLELVAHLTMPPAGNSEFAVFEPRLPGVAVSDAKTRRDGDVLTISAALHGDQGTISLDRSRLRITVLGSSYAVEVTGCTAP